MATPCDNIAIHAIGGNLSVFRQSFDFFPSQAFMAASEYHQKFEEIPKFVSSSLVLTLRCRFTSGVCMSANGKCGFGGLLSQYVKA